MDRRLIIEHIPRLRRYARALVGDRYVADDLVQDTLERAWNKFYLWRPGSDLRAWLFTIMHNVFVNQVRRRRYEIEQAMDELPAIAVRATQGEQLELQDVDRVLRSLKREELSDLRDSSGRVVVKCEFCSTEYAYDEGDLDRIYASAA